MISKVLKVMKALMDQKIQGQPSLVKCGKGLERKLRASVGVRS